ncbi:unnamed protein product [Closterium sp. NIES-53]
MCRAALQLLALPAPPPPLASHPAALRVAPCCSQCAACYCCPARRALLQPARRALLQPSRRALLPCVSRPTAASASLRALLPHTSRPAALHSVRPAALSTARSVLQPVAHLARPSRAAQPKPSCPAQAAPPYLDHQPHRATLLPLLLLLLLVEVLLGVLAVLLVLGLLEVRLGMLEVLLVPDVRLGVLEVLLEPEHREWVLPRARPGGGGFGFLHTTQRRRQSQQENFSPRVLSELFPQRCVTGSLEAAALGASESAATLGASECATALGASESAAALGARASPATAVPSGSLSGLHLPTFSTNLVSNAAIQDVWVDTFIPGGQRVAICQVAALSQVSASGQLAASCSCLHQTLLWHHRLGHPSLFCLCAPVGGTDQERYFQLVVDDYTRYTIVFPLQRKANVSGVLIPVIRVTRRQLRERFSRDFPVLRLHSDRGGQLSSDLLAEFCRDEGIVQSFTLPTSPHQNGIAECRIGLIMEVAHTSMIHAAAPHFLWPDLAHIRWTGKVGNASVFRVWGALSLVRDGKASKLSSCTLCCVFLGFPTDASRSCRVFSSQDVTFDESVSYYRLHLHASHPVPLVPLFLVPVPPLVDPLPPQGPAPSAVFAAFAATAVDSGAKTAGAEHGGVETEGEGSRGVATGGAYSGGPASPSGGGAVGDPTGGPGAGQPPQPDLLETLSPQAILAWILRRGKPGGGGYGPARTGAASPGGTAGVGGAAGAGRTSGAVGAGGTRGAAGAGVAGATSPRGATGAGGAGPTSPGGTAGAGDAGGAAGARGAGAGGTRGAGAAGPRGAHTGGAGAAGAGGFVRAGGATGAAGSGGTGGIAGAGGARAVGAGDTAGARCAGGATGAAGTGGAGGTAGARGAGAAGLGGAHTRDTGAAGAGAAAGAGGAGGATGATGTGGVGGTTGARGPGAAGANGAGGAAGDAGAGGAGAADQSQPQLLPSSPLLAPAPHSEHVVLPESPASSLLHVPDPESNLARAASPTVTRLLATVVTDPDPKSTAAFALVIEPVDFAARSRFDYVASLITES